MIDHSADIDPQPSDAAPADDRDTPPPVNRPQDSNRGKPAKLAKLGVPAIRKGTASSSDLSPDGDSSGRSKPGLRSRFKAGFKPLPRGNATRPPNAPSAQNAQNVPDAATRTPSESGQVRVLKPEVVQDPARPDGVRLSKIMAERGLCSRREADQIIERGWVSVDGRRVSQLGIRISPDAIVELAPEANARQAAQITILLHKPVGYVSGQPEPEHVPAVTLINAQTQFDRDVSQRFHPEHLRGLAPAGRLDIDSTGLLVLTQNGRIARQLIGDDSKVEKEYLVRVEGGLDEAGLAQLNHGLELDGRKLRPARVEWVNEDQLRFVLREGRKRQIRRMCELVGLNVVGLKRVRIGRVRLGDLPMGQWRYLRDDEFFV